MNIGLRAGSHALIVIAALLQNKRRPVRPPIETPQRYFFLVLPKLVCTLSPSAASICLACSAFGPSGCSSRYLLKFSAVPGGAVILPDESAVAFCIRFTAFS